MTPTPFNTSNLHGGCAEAFNCRQPEVLVEGPAGTGKTFGDCVKAHAIAQNRPGSRQLFIRKTRASMTESIMVTFERDVLGLEHPIVVNGPRRAHRHSYDYPNGSTIVVAGMDNPGRALSTEWDRIIEFEAIEFAEEEHETLVTRLGRHNMTPYPQIVAETNPGTPAHWLNRRANKGGMQRIVTRHRDNPLLWDHATNQPTARGKIYLELLDRLTGHRRARLRDGRWAASEGLVYPEFDPSPTGHLIEAMPAGWEKWPKRRAIDFGYNDPFVCQWWAGHDDEWYLYREVYMPERTVRAHAQQVAELSRGESYEVTVTDHDREDRETLHENGVSTSPAQKDIDKGIDAVKARLLRGGNGRPRLYFLKSALVERSQILEDAKRPCCTVEEFDAYLYKQHRDGVAKDEPVDRDNHGMDTMRYLVMSLGAPSVYVGYGAPPPQEKDWTEKTAPRVIVPTAMTNPGHFWGDD